PSRPVGWCPNYDCGHLPPALNRAASAGASALAAATTIFAGWPPGPNLRNTAPHGANEPREPAIFQAAFRVQVPLLASSFARATQDKSSVASAQGDEAEVSR